MSTAEFELVFARYQFRANAKVRKNLWKKLAKLHRDGIATIPALTEIRGLRKPTEPLSIAIAEWVRGMNNGRKFSEVIKPWVQSEEYMLIMAGEQSGTFETALLSVVTVATAKATIRATVIAGLAYPLFLVMAAFGLLYLFGYKIIPAFTRSARGDHWQGQARLMIDVSHFVQNWLHWILLLVIIVVIAFFFSLPHWNSPRRVLMDRYVPYSIYRVMQGSSWLIALAALVQAGVRIEDALENLGRGASAWSSVRTSAALKGLRSGRNLGESLSMSGYEFPDAEIISDLRLYATKSGFDEALRAIGNDWITESVDRISQLMNFIFAIGIVMVGGILGFVVQGLIAMQLQLTATR